MKGLSDTFKSPSLAKGNNKKINNQLRYHCIGEVYSNITDDGNIICLKWKDKRMVHIISIFHTDDMMGKWRRTRAVIEGVETVQKPVMIENHNLNMGGFNKSDQLELYYE